MKRLSAARIGYRKDNIHQHTELPSDQPPSFATVDIHQVHSRGAVVTYYVGIGCFALEVVLLNMEGRAPRGGKEVLSAASGNSSTEVLLMMGASNRRYVAKRFHFTGSTWVLRKAVDGEDWLIQGGAYDLEMAVVEYAFARVCAALGISLKMGSPDHGFDIICY